MSLGGSKGSAFTEPTSVAAGDGASGRGGGWHAEVTSSASAMVGFLTARARYSQTDAAAEAGSRASSLERAARVLATPVRGRAKRGSPIARRASDALTRADDHSDNGPIDTPQNPLLLSPAWSLSSDILLVGSSSARGWHLGRGPRAATSRQDPTSRSVVRTGEPHGEIHTLLRGPRCCARGRQSRPLRHK